jgi:hypothetical protein
MLLAIAKVQAPHSSSAKSCSTAPGASVRQRSTSARPQERLWRRCVPAILLLLLLELLASCSLGVRSRSLTGGKLRVEVRAAETANQNQPVAMDVLLIYNKRLLQELLKMSASDWFDKRDQIKRDDPKGKALRVWSWEWVPGQHALVELPLQAKARTGIIFARYFSRGEHRARIDPHTSIIVELLDKDFGVRLMP